VEPDFFLSGGGNFKNTENANKSFKKTNVNNTIIMNYTVIDLKQQSVPVLNDKVLFKKNALINDTPHQKKRASMASLIQACFAGYSVNCPDHRCCCDVDYSRQRYCCCYHQSYCCYWRSR
jgi:hypothetical protein